MNSKKITAAQQPVQEGGGCMCDPTGADGQACPDATGTLLCCTAPASAPVGGQCVASPGEEQKPPHTPALRWLDDREGVATQEWQGGFNVAYSYYTQQPAQAAPGVVEFPPTRFIDGMGWAVACSDAVQYVASLRSALRALAQQSNPPGDDAAGGGHVCVWTEQHDGEAWDGGCGATWQFMDGGPADNDMRHCPKCGNRVEIADQKESEE